MPKKPTTKNFLDRAIEAAAVSPKPPQSRQPAEFRSIPLSEIARRAVQFEKEGMLGLPYLLRAVGRGEVVVITPARESAIPARAWFLGLPGIILIGDDPPRVPAGERSAGPKGWAATPFLRSWASAAVIHAAADDVKTYQAAVDAALAVQRVALIETSAERAPAWTGVFEDAGIPALVHLPKSRPHPLPGDAP